MDYLKQMNAYNLKLITEPISPNARSVYISLLDVNNKLGWAKEFSISNGRLAETAGLSVQQLNRARQELIDNRYLKYEKSNKKIQTGKYSIPRLYQNNENFNTTSELDQNTNRTPSNISTEDQAISLNKLNKTKQNKTIKKNINTKKSKQEKTEQEKKTDRFKNFKKDFGEFKNVKLTQEEYAKLAIDFTELKVKELIEELSQYIASKGVRYKSHYATIQQWARRKGIVRRTVKEGIEWSKIDLTKYFQN